MVTIRPGALVLVSVLTSVASVPAVAQRAVSVGVAAGAAAVQGGGVAPSGAIAVEYQTPVRALAIRGEADFSSRLTSGPVTRVTALTVNGVFGASRAHGVSPYLIAGVGAYAQPGVGTRPGINAGLGLRTHLGSATPFVELRTHMWSRSAGAASRITPLQIGVTFRP
jgi:hypothetical protein